MTSSSAGVEKGTRGRWRFFNMQRRALRKIIRRIQQQLYCNEYWNNLYVEGFRLDFLEAAPQA